MSSTLRIITSWDDGTIEDMKLFNLLLKYNLPAIFYWPVYPARVNEIKGRSSLSEEQMKTIASKFEVGSHTLTHPLLTRIRLGLVKAEIENSRMFLQSKFNQEVNSFCYPRGYANPEIQMSVKQAGYKTARSTLVGYIHESENPFFLQTAAHVGMDRKEYAGLSWYDYALKMLKEAKKTANSVYHIWGHSFEIEKNNAWGQLEDLFSQLRA